MSENEKLPEQLSLPFFNDDTNHTSAKIFFLSRLRENHENSISAGRTSSKDLEEEIIERVLERADQLSWYK